MRKLAVAMLVAGMIAASVAAQVQPTAPSLAERILDARLSPLRDPGAGQLYPLASGLLGAARHMPQSIELTRPPIPAEQEGPDSQAQPPAGAQPQPAETPNAPKWRQVLDAPVVEDEKLAYAYYLAGSYAEAAGLYRRLHEQEPDNVHFHQMLFLSARNAGDAQAAAALLEELKSKPESQDWAEWIDAMLTLSPDAKEEP